MPKTQTSSTIAELNDFQQRVEAIQAAHSGIRRGARAIGGKFFCPIETCGKELVREGAGPWQHA